jgi:hypothetical protein
LIDFNRKLMMRNIQTFVLKQDTKMSGVGSSPLAPRLPNGTFTLSEFTGKLFYAHFFIDRGYF